MGGLEKREVHLLACQSEQKSSFMLSLGKPEEGPLGTEQEEVWVQPWLSHHQAL